MPFPSQNPLRRHFLSSLALAPFVSPFLQAQFSSSVKVISVLATVRDKDGKVVKGLTKDDFMLSEDDRAQNITYFSQQSDLPLTLGLLVDTSGSERRNIGTERDASYKFLETVLRPEKDKAFIIHFDREVELLQDLTASRERLEQALDLLQASDRSRINEPATGTIPTATAVVAEAVKAGTEALGAAGASVSLAEEWDFPVAGDAVEWVAAAARGGGGRQGMHGGGTKFFDAVYLAADEILQKQQGRKAVVMLTDGEDNGSKETMDSAIRSAQRAEMLGYSIHIADESGGGFSRGFGGGRGGALERPDGKKILKQISKATGGGYFEFKKSLDDIYSQINEELRNQYSIGYTSDKPEAGGNFRKIQLTTKQKGLVVQSRDGYYS